MFAACVQPSYKTYKLFPLPCVNIPTNGLVTPLSYSCTLSKYMQCGQQHLLLKYRSLVREACWKTGGKGLIMAVEWVGTRHGVKRKRVEPKWERERDLLVCQDQLHWESAFEIFDWAIWLKEMSPLTVIGCTGLFLCPVPFFMLFPLHLFASLCYSFFPCSLSKLFLIMSKRKPQI